MQASIKKTTPGNSKLAVRFFLGRTQAIGILGRDAPLLWHTFDLPEETQPRSWERTRRSGCRGGMPDPHTDRHGRRSRPARIRPHIQPQAFREKTGARLLRCGEPGYEPVGRHWGRLWPLLSRKNGLDLARGFKPPVPIREIFPWGELSLQGALVAGVSLFLHGTVELETQLKTTQVVAKGSHG